MHAHVHVGLIVLLGSPDGLSLVLSHRLCCSTLLCFALLCTVVLCCADGMLYSLPLPQLEEAQV